MEKYVIGILLGGLIGGALGSTAAFLKTPNTVVLTEVPGVRPDSLKVQMVKELKPIRKMAPKDVIGGISGITQEKKRS